ncbi:DNA-processing protein DprA [Rhodococcus tukisamuensis]|uniref:DNA processing protein n=1 Tax=Rhodococcus tukisamuensis TaxID=168276 RepID=A0A1G6MNS2_9NOCA|nr:DNA-processing protein DprA [Rhodococcus tukisamuensis]SDC57121.1 DNA processing protein [Rhodococcus tukisamuensis]
MDEQPTLFPLEDVDVSADAGDAADLQTALGLLALMDLPRVGSGRAIRFAQQFGSAEAFNTAAPEQRQRAGGVAVEDPVQVLDRDVPDGARLVGYFDDDYPTSLRGIANPPAVLWIQGALPDPARRIAIVGTRSATRWGASMAASIAEAAAAAGVSVVSGLALGIDIAAHRAALAAGGHTVAVLGSGIDTPTPREHQADAHAIVEAGSCLISEVGPGTRPSARTLVARNRIQSGLSYATVVVQCGLKSGTMTTAKFTREQERELVLPVPPEEEQRHPENAGSAALARLSPPPRLLQVRGDLADLLTEIR